MLEYKGFLSEFKAEGDRGEYKGHFSIFGNVDDGMDVVHPGAFQRTLEARRNRIKVFYAHDWEKLIGPPPTVINEDDIGLYAEGRLTLDSFWGRETWALMKDQALTEGSIGYRTVKADWAENGVRHIFEVELYEISPVPLGMNPLTSVQAVKALLRGMPDSSQDGAGADVAYWEAWAQKATLMTEALKAGRVLSSASRTQVQGALDALSSAVESLSGLLSHADSDDEAGFVAARARLERRARAAGLVLAKI